MEQNTISAHAEWEGGRKIGISVRDFPVMYVDEPHSLGGEDRAPKPEEYTLAALQGCYANATLLLADELGIPIQEMSSDTVAVFENQGQAPTPLPNLRSVTHHVHVRTEAELDQVERLRRLVDNACPTMKMLRASGVDVVSAWDRIE